MRPENFLEHALLHSVYDNIGIDDHHDAPENIEIANTTLSVPSLFVGPVNWDISIPEDAIVVAVTLRSNHTVQNGGAKAGVLVIATDEQFAATGMTLGGHGTITSTAYNMVYSKASSDANLSDKIFSNIGTDVSLSQAYILNSSGRKLRLEFTNYYASARTLNCWGEVAVIG